MLFIVLSTALLSVSNVSAATKNIENGFKSLAKIEAALNPLEILSNHGGIRTSIDLNIVFAFNSAQLLSEAQRQIAALGEALAGESLRHCIISLTGHTDATGNADSNQQLSKQRASTVKKQLVRKYGVLSGQLITIGQGESQLLNQLPPDDARHRRVEVGLADLKACRETSANRQKIPIKAANNKVSKDKNAKLKIEW